MSAPRPLTELLRENMDLAPWEAIDPELLREAADRLEALTEAANDLIELWDASSDVLGPEWVGLAHRIGRLERALERGVRA